MSGETTEVVSMGKKDGDDCDKDNLVGDVDTPSGSPLVHNKS